ncbi:MAG TPA: hypothetical protein VFT45_18600 [Longimicrobium sp.]|nr:hypothetical protein [Longimicrobium sp.]
MMTKHLARATFALLLAAAAAAPAAAQQQTPEARAQQERERASADRVRANAARTRAERARQQTQERAAFREDAERRAFDMLLNHRTQLQLSEQQVRQLESIRGRLEQQNAPLRARLVEEHQRVQAERRAQLERMSAEQRREELRRLRRDGRPGVPEALQPTVRQMRLNINEAVHQAQGVLTAEQRLRAQTLLRAQMQRARRAEAQGQQGRRRPRGEMQRRRQERRERIQGRRP